MNAGQLKAEFSFPHRYEVKVLESYSLVHPTEKLYHFPAELEEGDRSGAYVRVAPEGAPAWIGFFVLGFDSEQVASGIYSCPNAAWLCVAVGGYAYVINTTHPEDWFQIAQRPVVAIRSIPELNLLLFTGFTDINAVGESGLLWTTERLSWEGLSISKIDQSSLHGLGWDAIADKEVPFEVDLLTGKSQGGARPARKS
jgi:hypothetical protein